MHRHLAVLAVFASVLSAQAVVLRSGNVPAGQLEPNITYLQGPSAGAFAFPLTAAEFAAARAGSQATVRTSLAGWPLQLPGDPQAQWIDTQGGSYTALYAIPFNVGQTFTSAVLRLEFSVDDFLGEATVPGVYVNELPVAGSGNIGGYYFVDNQVFTDVGPMLQPGQNWLYLYGRNTGGAGGLMFSARLTLDGGAVRRFGSGCSGSAGTPILLAGSFDTTPGAAMPLRLYNLPTTPAPVVMAFGIDNRTSFGMPAPADLGFLGFPGCSGLFEILGTALATNTGGAAVFPMAMPGQAFVGQSLYTQGFVFDAATARGASVSNGLELRAGP